jgi:hypothetical protein
MSKPIVLHLGDPHQMEPRIIQEAEREMQSCADTKRRAGTTDIQTSTQREEVWRLRGYLQATGMKN